MTMGQGRLHAHPSPRLCAELLAADLSWAAACKMGSVGPGLVPWACPWRVLVPGAVLALLWADAGWWWWGRRITFIRCGPAQPRGPGHSGGVRSPLQEPSSASCLLGPWSVLFFQPSLDPRKVTAPCSLP